MPDQRALSSSRNSLDYGVASGHDNICSLRRCQHFVCAINSVGKDGYVVRWIWDDFAKLFHYNSLLSQLVLAASQSVSRLSSRYGHMTTAGGPMSRWCSPCYCNQHSPFGPHAGSRWYSPYCAQSTSTFPSNAPGAIAARLIGAMHVKIKLAGARCFISSTDRHRGRMWLQS